MRSPEVELATRRPFLVGVGMGLLAWLTSLGSARAADKKVTRIGVTKIVAHPALDAAEKGFEVALTSAGFKEGVNVIYDRQNAQGDAAKADEIARKFVAAKTDLIHAISTPSAQAVIKTQTDIAIVFSGITDPVRAAIVPAESAPGNKTGTNVTGVSDPWPVRLQLETYAKFVPQAKKWGTIYNPAEANSVSHIQTMREAAKVLGLELIEAHAANTAEVKQAALSLMGKVQAINITSDNTSVANIAVIAQVCNQNQTPLFAGDVDSVPKGAIAAYGMDYFLVGYSAGKKAALVLKGVKPGDIPWGPVEKFSLVVNQTAARLQGVRISDEMRKRADKVLE